MKKLEYRVTFNTPAFLGNAEQKGQWRTPPFKALLRQWWRVAFAAEKGFQPDVAGMRREEGRLFGAAAEPDSEQEPGAHAARPLGRGDARDGGGRPSSTPRSVPVDSGLYLAYGPIVLRKGQKRPMLKEGAAIQATDSATLRFAFPETHADRIGEALALIDRYGAVGGRSRNGWGSFSLTPLNGTPALRGEIPVRHWREALALDWPHAIGEDEKGALVWQTRPFADWKALMRELARVKMGCGRSSCFRLINPRTISRWTDTG